MSKNRIRFEAVICCNAVPGHIHDVGNEIVRKLARHYGGATWSRCSGAWAANGNSDLRSYSEIKVDPGIKVSLSVYESEKDIAYDLIRSVVSDVISRLSFPAQFVHMESFLVEAMHFDARESVAL